MTPRQNQTLQPLHQYWLSEHALLRMRQRHISPNEILDTITLASEWNFNCPTREGRTRYYPPSLGVTAIVDDSTGIVVTVTENDERKQRLTARHQHGCRTVLYPPNEDQLRSQSPLPMVTLVK